MLRDLHHSVEPVVSVAPGVATTVALSGAGVDRAGHNAVEVVFAVGTPAVTLSSTIKLTLSVQESDEAATGYTDVAAGDTLGVLPVIDAPALAGKAYAVGYIGAKRYVRAVIAPAGAHGDGTPVAATVVRAFPRQGVGTVA